MRVPLTPLDFLTRAARIYAPLESIVDGERRLTYGQFAGRARRLAHLLHRDYGVEPNDRVAYLCGNTLELLEAYYGVLLAGAILTPLNIRLAPAELQFILDDCGARVLAVHPSFEDAADRLTGVERLELDSTYDDRLDAQPAGPVDAPPVDEDAVCELFYTSGTTGTPKGVMLTHRNLATHAVDSALTLGLTHRDVVLHTIPLFHVNGWGTPHYVTALGATHVLLERFDTERVLQLIEEERVTRLSIVPTMASALLISSEMGVRDVSSLLQVTVGGAPPGPELMADLEDAFACEVICGYGLTEAAPQLTKATTLRSHDALPLAEQRKVRATTGIPNVGVDARVLDDAGAEVSWDGETPGEICVRSNHVMAGYWNRPEETAAAMRDGWLRTGDIATVDAEGYLTIVDRKKDLVISGGENISSVEVEKAIASHPAVLEVAVVGMPHERWGEVPRAFVALKPGAEGVDAETLAQWVRDRLAGFKVPKRFDFLSELPKGGSGKILKTDLRRRAT